MNFSIKINWGGRWESNPRMPEPQSGVLTTSPRPPYLIEAYLPQRKNDYIQYSSKCKEKN